jgi:hypothetical protein
MTLGIGDDGRQETVVEPGAQLGHGQRVERLGEAQVALPVRLFVPAVHLVVSLAHGWSLLVTVCVEVV